MRRVNLYYRLSLLWLGLMVCCVACAWVFLA
jgi:hypothetical protein